MFRNKVFSYILSGLFLLYFGIKDLHSFNVLYNGIAILLSLVAFVLALMEYKNNPTK